MGVLTMSDIADRISNVVVSRLHIEPVRVTEAANFVDDFAATSLDIVETIMSLEDEFGIEISDREAEKLHTVGDVVTLIKTKVPEAADIRGFTHAFVHVGGRTRRER
jgi:acyl carrier protein